MRKPHYWKKAGRACAPNNMLVFDCETWHGEYAKVPGGELQTFRLAVATAFRLDNGKRTREKWVHTKDPVAIRDLILSRLSKDRPLWVWGHNLPYDIGAAKLWGLIRNEHYLVEKAAISSGIFWIKGEFDGCGLVYCDTLNYLTSSLASIGNVLGFPKLDMPRQDESDDVWFEYCHRDVEVTVKAIESVIAFVRENNLGPWQPTKTGLSFSAYRHRFMQHKVLVHSTEQVLEMERRAYYGGIVDTAFIGKTPNNPVRELDVCSMYPSMCLGELPTKLRGTTTRAGLEALKRLLDSHMCIADVTLDTHTHTYPTRHKGKVYHPLGRYRTSLADPELRLALSRGHIASVHRIAWYDHAPIFRHFMQWMVGKKKEYKDLGNDVFSLMCKLMANGLYGKTGQLTPRWQEWGKESLAQLEFVHRLPRGSLTRYKDSPPHLTQCEDTIGYPELGVVLDVRDYWGRVEVCTGHGESRDSCPAVAATVTSYARCLLRGYQETAGQGHWYYSDTDSIWVDDVGYFNLLESGEVDFGVLGKLDVQGTYDWMVIHGPKDYETPTKTKLKGIKKNAVHLWDNSFVQLQFPSATVQLTKPNDAGVFVKTVAKTLRRQVDRAVVLSTGWTRPLVFPAELP
jgi:hypothetical protein